MMTKTDIDEESEVKSGSDCDIEFQNDDSDHESEQKVYREESRNDVINGTPDASPQASFHEGETDIIASKVKGESTLEHIDDVRLAVSSNQNDGESTLELDDEVWSITPSEQNDDENTMEHDDEIRHVIPPDDGNDDEFTLEHDDDVRLAMAKELVSTGRPLSTCLQAMHLMHDDIAKATSWLLSPASHKLSSTIYFCCDDEPRTVEEDDFTYNFDASRNSRGDYEYIE